MNSSKDPLSIDQWHKVLFENDDVTEAVKLVVESYTGKWHEELLRYTTKGQSFLETGSGTGQMSAFLSKNERKTFLMDLSEKNLEFSKALFQYLSVKGNFICADILQPFPFEDNCFDCVWSEGVLEHFTDEQIVFILQESSRVSKKLVISMVPNAVSLAYRFGKWFQELRGYWKYGKEDPKFSMKKYFYQAGLSDIKEYCIDPAQSFKFLTMLNNRKYGKIIIKILQSIPQKALLALDQGWLVVTVGYKKVN